MPPVGKPGQLIGVGKLQRPLALAHQLVRAFGHPNFKPVRQRCQLFIGLVEGARLVFQQLLGLLSRRPLALDAAQQALLARVEKRRGFRRNCLQGAIRHCMSPTWNVTTSPVAPLWLFVSTSTWRPKTSAVPRIRPSASD